MDNAIFVRAPIWPRCVPAKPAADSVEGATLCVQPVTLRTQAVARRGYPPLQGGLKLTRPQQSACSAFIALCAEVEPLAR